MPLPIDDIEAAKLEAQALSAWFCDVFPRHAERREALQCEDMPEVANVLWSSLGWSADVAKANVIHPTDAARLTEREAEYEGWGADLKGLPRKRRLVVDEAVGTGFLITDEKPGKPDSRLVWVDDGGGVSPIGKSYAQWCGDALTRRISDVCHHAQLRIKPTSALLGQAEQPFPLLSPRLYSVGEDIWFEVESDHVATIPKRPDRFRVVSPSYEDLVSFLMNLSGVDKLEVTPNTAARYLADIKVAEVGAGKFERDRIVQFTPLGREGGSRVGRIEGVPVIVGGRNRWVSIWVAPAQADAFPAVAEGRGWKRSG